MRHAAVSFAEQLVNQSAEGPFDLLFCSDYLNLAEFRGLAPTAIGRLPAILYFHENQFAYPSRRTDPRDLHFAFTNFVSCLAADEIWFNSAFNRDTFFQGLEQACRYWPDDTPRASMARLQDKCRIEPPGIAIGHLPAAGHPSGAAAEIPDRDSSSRQRCCDQPSLILWAARWEHDKNPGLLLAGLREMRQRGIDLRLSVIGQSFSEVPGEFTQIRDEFAACLSRWGFQESTRDYRMALAEADLFLSTADHEFFGIAAAEAIAGGLFPVLPDRLAYPELMRAADHPRRAGLFLYDGTAAGLASCVENLIHHRNDPQLLRVRQQLQAELTRRLAWCVRGPHMDEQLERIRAFPGRGR
jgi:glycosyltransferase involved in cell wall biosynthesis